VLYLDPLSSLDPQAVVTIHSRQPISHRKSDSASRAPLKLRRLPSDNSPVQWVTGAPGIAEAAIRTLQQMPIRLRTWEPPVAALESQGRMRNHSMKPVRVYSWQSEYLQPEVKSPLTKDFIACRRPRPRQSSRPPLRKPFENMVLFLSRSAAITRTCRTLSASSQ
jgi:hypothetical protein